MKYFLCLVHACTIAPMRAIVDLLTKKSKRRTFDRFPTGSALNEDQMLAMFGSERVLEVLRVS